MKYKDYVSQFCGMHAGEKSVSKALFYDFLVIVYPILLINFLMFKRMSNIPKN